MARSGPGTSGTRCKNCGLTICRFTMLSGIVTWIHSYTTNVWCQTEFVGATAKFADPG